MIVLDTTIVNVALPTIRNDLGYEDTSLIWVVNAYTLSYSASLLLGGRLGDLYGRRRIFILGTAAFTFFSLVCGLVRAPGLLVIARALQGFGGAAVVTVGLPLILTLFTDQPRRARAVGAYALVCSGGAGVGVLLGGLLTAFMSWHWIFFVNVPIGISVCLLSLVTIRDTQDRATKTPLDVGGAIAITLSIALVIYALSFGPRIDWDTISALALSALAAFGLFLGLELYGRHPLVPLGIFRSRNFAVANLVAALWAVASAAWYFVATLYMQRALGFGPLAIGLVFLPGNLVSAVLSLGLAPSLITRFGIKATIAAGLMLTSFGFFLSALHFARWSSVTEMTAILLIVGVGEGLTFNPLLLAVTQATVPERVGLASGILETVCVLSGSVGVAMLTSIATTHTTNLLSAGIAARPALAGGYHMAFGVAALCAALGTVLNFAFLKQIPSTP